jgi:hypothetical protein
MTGVERVYPFPYLCTYRSYMYRVITNDAGDYINLLLRKGVEHKNYTPTFIKSNAKQFECVRKKRFHLQSSKDVRRRANRKKKKKTIVSIDEFRNGPSCIFPWRGLFATGWLYHFLWSTVVLGFCSGSFEPCDQRLGMHRKSAVARHNILMLYVFPLSCDCMWFKCITNTPYNYVVGTTRWSM